MPAVNTCSSATEVMGGDYQWAMAGSSSLTCYNLNPGLDVCNFQDCKLPYSCVVAWGNPSHAEILLFSAAYRPSSENYRLS